VLSTLDRWPTWMWANEEVAAFGEWLRGYNQQHPDAPVSFYGMDVYSLHDSMKEVLRYLQDSNANAAQRAQAALDCFAQVNGDDEFEYAQQKAQGKIDCADELENLLSVVEEQVSGTDDDEAFNAVQNAIIALNAERYYVAALQGGSSSWNIRDRHMMTTIDRLREQGGDSKMIIWAHNTHVGDARATDMQEQGMVNIGQLIREKHSDEGVYITGFGSYQGSVIAASSWGNKTQSMEVPPGITGSWEAMLHAIAPVNKIVFLDNLRGNNALMQRIGHRAIGVVYNPAAEQGNYVPSILPERYNAFVFIDETEALTPLYAPAIGRRNVQTSTRHANSMILLDQ
jgi:erythromycin esterase